MKHLASIISYLFHPLLMATYGCLIVFFGLTNTIYFLFTPLKLKLILTLVVFAFTFLLPVLNLLILHKFNFVSSLKIDKQSERTFPLIMTALCYFGLFYMLFDFNIWPAVKLFILGGGICISANAIINIWYKISAHMIGIGGLIGSLLALCYYMQIQILVIISICIVLAGFIAFSRLFLKAHSPTQIYAGFILGCVLQFSLFYLAQRITFV
ncbi:MAG: hypothetical protein K9H41_01620 [Bacteroidia bacterium]|nr:hypothetical protein [Bacteroidia bacterium]